MVTNRRANLIKFDVPTVRPLDLAGNANKPLLEIVLGRREDHLRLDLGDIRAPTVTKLLLTRKIAHVLASPCTRNRLALSCSPNFSAIPPRLSANTKHTNTATARQWEAVPGEEGDFIPHAPGLGVCVLDIENRISAVALWQLLEEVVVSGILITGL